MDKENKNGAMIEELINVFLEIDRRIKMLHQDSSDVFLKLNSFLKDYHKKYGIITANVNRIFEAIVGKQGEGLIEEYDTICKELNKYKELAESDYQKSYILLKHLKTKINYSMVVLRNFKQDLTTLKFLTTNYRLLSNSGSLDNKIPEPIIKWESTALSIREGISLLTREFEEIITKTDIILSGIEEFTSDSLDIISQYNEDLKTTHSIINRKNQESKSHLPVLKEKMDNSGKCIGNIITHLQYHDIIRQKIEHIQATHQQIVKDLEKKEVVPEASDISEDDKRFSMISDIAGLQAAQLILISKEYQKALEVITQNFQKIGGDLNSVSSISHEFSFEGDNSETTLINRVRDRMDKGVMMMDSFNFASFDREIRLLIDSFENAFKTAGILIFDPVEEFSDLFLAGKNPDKITKTNISTPNIMYQLSSLVRDILQKRDELQIDMEEIQGHIETYRNEKPVTELGSELESEQIKVMVSITRMLNRLDDENRELDESLSQNFNLNKDILSRLKETIDKVDYYELFDNVLSEIIEKLNTVNVKLGNSGQEVIPQGNIGKLKEIEALYTVASERIVHDNVLSGNKDIGMSDEKEDDDSDDLELF